MARKTVERNISYDDARDLYYVSMDLGRDEEGRRIKQYRTFPTLTAARAGLRDFLAHRDQERQTPPASAHPVRVAGILDGHHRAAQSGGNHGVFLSKDH